MKCIAPRWMSKSYKYFCICIASIVLLNIMSLQLGVLANKLVTEMNDGLMPITVEIAEVDRPHAYTTISSNTKLGFLGDVYSFRIPSETGNDVEAYLYRCINWIVDGDGPGLYLYSIGDMFIWMGSILLPVSLMVFLLMLGNILTREHRSRYVKGKI